MHLWINQLMKKSTYYFGIFSCALLLARCSLLSSSGLQHAKDLSLTAPSTWTETESEGDTDKAFKTAAGSMVTVTSSCQENRQVSLRNLTRDLLLGAKKVKFIQQQPMIIARTEALFSHVNTTVEGKAFQLLFIVLRKNSCVFDFSLVSPKPISQGEIQEFISFTKSFDYGQS